MKSKFIFLIALLFSFNLYGQENPSKLLRFKYRTGDSYRILSSVKELVKVNGTPHHSAEILNRITVNVTDTDENGRGYNESVFMTSESSVGIKGGFFDYGEEYESKFWRDEKGVYTISDEYFMPVVRDVPVFPEKPVKIGDKWTYEGHEAHDLRHSFEIYTPFKVSFTAQYEYIRDEGDFQVIKVKYNLYAENPMPENPKEDFPVTTMGYSNQTIWWDNEKGQIDHYSEDFRIVIETYFGNQFDFYGTAHAEVTDFERTATEKNLIAVQEKVQELGLKNVSVTKSDKGLTISMENIQFKPNSAELLESEKEKIMTIAKIIENFSNDLLISGHTARSGTEESCQILSKERADSVADYLIQIGVRDKYHLMTQGFGSKVPIATNKTKEGMEKNRRVEITIMDK